MNKKQREKFKNDTFRSIRRCNSLDDVRMNIDRLDEEIIPLLCERIQYITQAAQFKETEHDVRIFGRIEAIITRARAYADLAEIDAEYIEYVYRAIIDESIRQETKKWHEINPPSDE